MIQDAPEAVELVSSTPSPVVVEPAAPASWWTMPVVGGSLLIGLSLLTAGAWFAINRRRVTRDQREYATHQLAKRAGLSPHELQAMQDLVTCVRGGETHGEVSTLGLIMAPYAAAELARSIESGFDRKQLARALQKLGAPDTLDLKAKKGKGASRKGPPAKGNDVIAARARAVLAAIGRARDQGYFDAKTGSPTGDSAGLVKAKIGAKVQDKASAKASAMAGGKASAKANAMGQTPAAGPAATAPTSPADEAPRRG